jgi:hypothetical protein
MSPFIPAAERVKRAHALIKQAYDLPVPADGGKYNFSYIAQVKDLLRQARDLVKFIPDSPTATDELKADVKAIFAAADQANQDILH